MDAMVRAAEDVVGTGLSDPVDLGGSTRSTVLRCRTAGGGSVVVKAFGQGPDAWRGFAAEAAGLSLGLAGPELLGVHAELPLLVLEDLGEAPSLADVLLGPDPAAARAGLLAWARGLGRLAAGSVDRRAELAVTAAGYRRDWEGAEWEELPWLAEQAEVLPALLERFGLPVPDGLVGELERIAAAGTGAYPAFTPGDTCPDNNLLTPDGLRLIDFEGACYQSVFLTAAYCRMPFSTCWCVFRLPEPLAAEVERTFRDELLTARPELADDARWEAGMAGAVAAWTVDATVRVLAGAVERDAPLHRTRRPVATTRQLLRHRWAAASALEGLPAVGEVARALPAAFDWDVPPLPGYPAFGG
ncbi:hypothetical protein ACIRBX_28050 [Kitasatospora sp. NPDC096147]|uniref:hypothetical protein n=1 Tax=Kitasatospora sp. NPDC096147 TaxID=3364093 RepID=UPI0037F46F31